MQTPMQMPMQMPMQTPMQMPTQMPTQMQMQMPMPLQMASPSSYPYLPMMPYGVPYSYPYPYYPMPYSFPALPLSRLAGHTYIRRRHIDRSIRWSERLLPATSTLLRTNTNTTTTTTTARYAGTVDPSVNHLVRSLALQPVTVQWLQRLADEVTSSIRPRDARLLWTLAHGLAYAPDVLHRVDFVLERKLLFERQAVEENSVPPLPAFPKNPPRPTAPVKQQLTPSPLDNPLPAPPLPPTSSPSSSSPTVPLELVTEKDALVDLLPEALRPPAKGAEYMAYLFRQARPPSPFEPRTIRYFSRWGLPVPAEAATRAPPEALARAATDARLQRLFYFFARQPYRAQHRWATSVYTWARGEPVGTPDKRLLDPLLDAAAARREWISVSFVLLWCEAARAFASDAHPTEYDWPSLGEFVLGAVQEQLRRFRRPAVARSAGLPEPDLKAFLDRHGSALVEAKTDSHALYIEWVRLQWQVAFVQGTEDTIRMIVQEWSERTGRDAPAFVPLPPETWSRLYEHDKQLATVWAQARVSDGPTPAPIPGAPAPMRRSDWVEAEMATVDREVSAWYGSEEAKSSTPLLPFLHAESAARALRAIAAYLDPLPVESQQSIKKRLRTWPDSTPYTPSGAPRAQTWKHQWRRAVMSEHWPLLAYLTVPFQPIPSSQDDEEQRTLGTIVPAAHIAALLARGLLENWIRPPANSFVSQTQSHTITSLPPSFRDLLTRVAAWTLMDWRRQMGAIRIVAEWVGEQGLYRDQQVCTAWYLNALQWLWTAWFVDRAPDTWMQEVVSLVLSGLRGYANHAAKDGALQEAGSPDVWNSLVSRTVRALWNETRKQMALPGPVGHVWLESCLHDVREWIAVSLLSTQLSSRRTLAKSQAK
jgi:hypothetical protein